MTNSSLLAEIRALYGRVLISGPGEVDAQTKLVVLSQLMVTIEYLAGKGTENKKP